VVENTDAWMRFKGNSPARPARKVPKGYGRSIGYAPPKNTAIQRLIGLKNLLPQNKERRQMDRPEVIAVRLKALRRAMGFDQASKWCTFVGIPENSWSHFEHGRRPITVEAAVKVADKCGASLDWIYRGEGQGPPEADTHGGGAAALADAPVQSREADSESLTITEAKRRLARSLGVAASSIKITIEA
jgi:transcriptional regulator with XRE-family HTH domain